MSYSAPNRLLMPMRHSIDTMRDAPMARLLAFNSSGAWPSANLAIYSPVIVPSRIVVLKLWVAAGSTGTGNVDMGVYDASGAAVISATNAAKSAATTEQVFDVTDTTLGPGLYYIALSSDSATDTYQRIAPAAPFAASCGFMTEAAAYPLPATATWTLDQTLAYIPLVGMLTEATVA